MDLDGVAPIATARLTSRICRGACCTCTSWVHTRAVPEFFQLTGRMVDGAVYTRHDRQKYGCHGH